MRKPNPQLYYSLLCRHPDRPNFWTPEFGDYDMSVVKSEHDDYRDKGYKVKDLKIIVTTDEQSSIMAAVAALNLLQEE